jgi:hypothetical protein
LNGTSSSGDLSYQLMTYCDFEMVDGLGEIGVFFFFLLEELKGLYVIRHLDFYTDTKCG